MTLTARLQRSLLPGRILDVRVGYSRTAVLAETDDGIRCGLAATLANSELMHHVRPAVRNAGHLLEMDPQELAALADSDSYTEVAIGMATINALLPRTPEQWVDLKAEDFLIENGARLDLFAAAMLGKIEIVKATLQAFPEAIRTPGPHGIPLIAHAKAGGDEAREVLEFLENVVSKTS